MYAIRPTSKFTGGPRRGLNGIPSVSARPVKMNLRGLGRMGDDTPPDPNILFGANPVTQQQFTNAVVGAVNEQVAADNAHLVGPSWTEQLAYWLKQTTNIAGQKISNAVIVSSGGFLVGLALISAGKGKR